MNFLSTKKFPGLKLYSHFHSKIRKNPGILTSKGVHTSLLPESSHQDYKALKVINIFESPMEIFPYSYGEDIRILDVPCLHFYPLEQLNSGTGQAKGLPLPFSVLCFVLYVQDCPDFEASPARGFVLRSLELQILSFIMGIQ
ncbi:hypothetical protein Tco_1558129 [Tanacetum coccineum]